MDKIKEKEHLKKIAQKVEEKDWKKSQELIKHLYKHALMSIELLVLKLKTEDALNKHSEALKTANLILFR